MAVSAARRDVVLGGLLAILPIPCIGGCCRSAWAAEQRAGCFIPAEDAAGYFAKAQGGQAFKSGNEAIVATSGNKALDRALAQSLAKLSRTFAVLPGFAYYDDSDGSNALATQAALLERTDGTVLFGLQLVAELLRRDDHPDAAVVAVCAHEFGHIVGYKTGLMAKLVPENASPFRGEQHADYLAGYFAGIRKLERPSFPAVIFATTQHSFGGGDHGTSDQRAQAVVEGFKAAYERRLDLSTAIDEGFAFAMSRREPARGGGDQE